MTRTDVAINDLARALADLKVNSQEQRRAVFEKSLQSLVRFAISKHMVSQIDGVRDDLSRVNQILAESRSRN